jgi:hypothetical protein
MFLKNVLRFKVIYSKKIIKILKNIELKLKYH